MKTWIVLGGTVFLLLVAILGSGTNDNYSSKRTSTAEPSAQAQADKKISEKTKVSCATIQKELGAQSNLTSVQKEDLWERKYKDKLVLWKFQLLSADQSYDESYEVTLVCLPPVVPSTLVEVTFPKEQKDKVLKFKANTIYNVNLKLQSFESAPPSVQDTASLKLVAEPQ